MTRSTRRTASSTSAIGTRPELDQRGQLRVVEVRHHVDVDARIEGLLGGRRGIERDAVMHQFHDGGVIADDEAIETPLLAEDGVEQIWIRAAGTPLSELKALITVAAPASTAALYGGR